MVTNVSRIKYFLLYSYYLVREKVERDVLELF